MDRQHHEGDIKLSLFRFFDNSSGKIKNLKKGLRRNRSESRYMFKCNCRNILTDQYDK